MTSIASAGIRHRVSRNAIYKWRAKYDGCWKSLVDKSRPKQHSAERKPKPYQRASYLGQKI